VHDNQSKQPWAGDCVAAGQGEVAGIDMIGAVARSDRKIKARPHQ
jgi:hypothetical protein